MASHDAEIYIIEIFTTENSAKETFSKLLKTATSESSFILDYLHYKPVERVAMVSPLSPTLANTFLCHYEKEWLDNCPTHFKSMIYRRYVDDILVLFYLNNTSNFL